MRAIHKGGDQAEAAGEALEHVDELDTKVALEMLKLLKHDDPKVSQAAKFVLEQHAHKIQGTAGGCLSRSIFNVLRSMH